MPIRTRVRLPASPHVISNPFFGPMAEGRVFVFGPGIVSCMAPTHPYLASSAMLHDLHARLGRGETFTLGKIQDTFGISERQARRKIDRLIQEGVPIQHRYENRLKVFFLEEQNLVAEIGPIRFTEEEGLALAAGLMAIEAVLGGTPLGKPARVAMQRLLDQLTDQVYGFELDEQPGRWYIQAIAKTRMQEGVFTTIVQGLAHNQRLRILYEKPQAQSANERWIDPLCIWVRDQAVLLTARQHQPTTTPSIKHFSLARIQEAEICPDVYFDRPADFIPEDYFRSDFQGIVTEGAVQTFRILASPAVAHAFREREHKSFQQIEEEREDGSVVVSWEGAGFEEWRTFFQGWGSTITVLEPESMRRRLGQDACILAARYTNP